MTLARVSLNFASKFASVLKLAGDETYWGVYDVRSTSLLFAAAPSHVVSMFMSAALLAEDPDSGASLVADWRTGEVASYLFNDVAPVDPEPADYFVVAPSVAAWLAQGGDDTDHRPSVERGRHGSAISPKHLARANHERPRLRWR